jgi:ribonuclease inhibitor
MREVNIEGRKMDSKERAQLHIQHRMDWPESYGKTLDALWDGLMGIRKNTMIHFFDPDIVKDQLGQYGFSLVQTFEDAAKANPKIVLEMDA